MQNNVCKSLCCSFFGRYKVVSLQWSSHLACLYTRMREGMCACERGYKRNSKVSCLCDWVELDSGLWIRFAHLLFNTPGQVFDTLSSSHQISFSPNPIKNKTFAFFLNRISLSTKQKLISFPYCGFLMITYWSFMIKSLDRNIGIEKRSQYWIVSSNYCDATKNGTIVWICIIVHHLFVAWYVFWESFFCNRTADMVIICTKAFELQLHEFQFNFKLLIFQ